MDGRLHRATLLLVAGAVVTMLAAGSPAAAQPAGESPTLTEWFQDLGAGLFARSGILQQFGQAFPAYALGALVAVLLGGFFGFFDIGSGSLLALGAAMAALIYRFYWPLWR